MKRSIDLQNNSTLVYTSEDEDIYCDVDLYDEEDIDSVIASEEVRNFDDYVDEQEYLGYREIDKDNPYFDEIPKYRKRGRRKSRGKSNHKHIYNREVLLKRPSDYTESGFRYSYAIICRKCGKIGKDLFFETKKVEGTNHYQMLSQEEILKKYEGLDIIHLSSKY